MHDRVGFEGVDAISDEMRAVVGVHPLLLSPSGAGFLYGQALLSLKSTIL